MRRLLSLFLFIFSVSLFSEVVIDVRTPDEFDVGHVQGSQNIEWENIHQIKETIKKDEKIFLYCRSGNRSGKATKILLDLGYKDCLLYTSPSPRDIRRSRMPSSA